MSGHSKWSTIKRKKGAADAKRGALFTRAIHEVSTAVREGGGSDPGSNARLRFAIDRAKAVNMSNDTIDRAIKRASGEYKDGSSQMELVYEGYGPGGSAVLVEVVTDNRNRTVGEVRNVFTKCGGTLGEAGSVGWMFKKKGVILVKAEGLSEDQVIEPALEAGAEDVLSSGEFWEVLTDPGELHSVRLALDGKLPVDTAEHQFIPNNSVVLSPADSEKMGRLIEMLEDLDDVLNVSTNGEHSQD